MSCELFVGNLNPDVRIRDLENCFGKYGKILRCDLKKNYAFIQISDKHDGEEAIRKENNRRLLGSVMTVEWAKGSTDSGKPGFGRVRENGGSPPGGFRKPRSPPGRIPERPGNRNRSPYGGGRPPRRDRSPIGRSNGYASRDDKFGGGRPPRSGQFRDAPSNFDNPRFDRGPPSGGDRYASRDSYQGNDRFNDRGPTRGPPPSRSDRFSDRPSRGGFSSSRSSFGERRSSFGGGSRRF